MNLKYDLERCAMHTFLVAFRRFFREYADFLARLGGWSEPKN